MPKSHFKRLDLQRSRLVFDRFRSFSRGEERLATYKGLMELREQGKVRAIGASRRPWGGSARLRSAITWRSMSLKRLGDGMRPLAS